MLLSPLALSFTLATLGTAVLASPTQPHIRSPKHNLRRHGHLSKRTGSPDLASDPHDHVYVARDDRVIGAIGAIGGEGCQIDSGPASTTIVYETVYATVTETVNAPNSGTASTSTTSPSAATSAQGPSSRPNSNGNSSPGPNASTKTSTSSAAAIPPKPTDTATSGTTNTGGLSSGTKTSAAAPSASSATPSSTPTNSGGGDYPSPKRGICYNSASAVQQFASTGKLGFGLNWGQDTGGLQGLKHYPQLSGAKAGMQESWKANVEKSGSKILFGFNEPENLMCQHGQSCISVPDAVAMWKTHMAGFHDQGKVLVSPGVAWGSPDVEGEGPNWLDQFMKACPDAECHVDEIALHWYGDASYTDVFQKYVTDMHTRYNNRNVWITEMRVDSGDASAFFAKVLPWLDSQSWIKGYAYFRADDMSASSGPGQQYLAQ